MIGRLAILFVILFPTSLYAQNIEAGLGGGISTNTVPSSNMYYKFDNRTINYAGAFSLLYNFADYMQYGLECHLSEISGKSDIIYNGPDNSPIGGNSKRFVYAKQDLSFCGIFNGKLNIGRGYIYGGGALGYNVARQRSTQFSANESYRAPDGGNGIVFGAQLGYVVGITGKLGLFVEGAYRYVDLKYDAEAPGISPKTDLHYHLTTYPFVIGIRYRILNTIMDNKFQHEKGDNSSRERK